MSEIKFETALVVSLQRYPRNARRRARNQILKIAASIAEFGFTNPILIDEKGEIIAGHGRLEAAIHLKMTTVPVLRVSGLSEVQKKALRLADNKLGEGSSWDPELLKLELSDLALTDIDLTLTAFDTIEIDKRLTPDLALENQDRPLPPVGDEGSHEPGLANAGCERKTQAREVAFEIRDARKLGPDRRKRFLNVGALARRHEFGDAVEDFERLPLGRAKAETAGNGVDMTVHWSSPARSNRPGWEAERGDALSAAFGAGGAFGRFSTLRL